MKTVDINILFTDKQFNSNGFAKISQVLIENIYEDGARGAPYSIDVVHRAGHDAVVIVPFGYVPDGKGGRYVVALRKQIKPILKIREGKNAMTWGLPAGCIKDGQTPLRCAIEEFEEELGVPLERGQEIFEMGPPLYSSLGWLTERIYFYGVELTDAQLQQIDKQEEVANVTGEAMEQGCYTKLFSLEDAAQQEYSLMFELALRRLNEIL